MGGGEQAEEGCVDEGGEEEEEEEGGIKVCSNYRWLSLIFFCSNLMQDFPQERREESSLYKGKA